MSEDMMLTLDELIAERREAFAAGVRAMREAAAQECVKVAAAWRAGGRDQGQAQLAFALAGAIRLDVPDPEPQ